MMAIAAVKPNRRALSKQRRRQQLIDATIKCISKKGLGSLTLADVAIEASLSQGIVNLHFDSKDNLLKETLRFLAEDYDAQFMQTLELSSCEAAETLMELMQMDLNPAVCDRKKTRSLVRVLGRGQDRTDLPENLRRLQRQIQRDHAGAVRAHRRGRKLRRCRCANRYRCPLIID